MEEKERNNKGRCKVTGDGIIACEVKLTNGGRISQQYKVPPKYVPIVEKDFIENIVKPRQLELRKEGNVLQKIRGTLEEKDIKCEQEYIFKNEGPLRVLEQRGRCIKEEEKWKKFLRTGKNIADLIK